MALYHYCTCGAKIAYETAKPAKCPKCTKPLKDAVAILNKAIQAAPIVSEDPYDEGDMDEGLTPQNTRASVQETDDDFILPPARGLRSQPVKRKTRQRSTFAEGRAVINVDQEDGDNDDSDDEGGAGEAYDGGRVAALRRKMIQAYAGVADELVISPSVKGENMTFKQLHDQAKQQQG